MRDAGPGQAQHVQAIEKRIGDSSFQCPALAGKKRVPHGMFFRGIAVPILRNGPIAHLDSKWFQMKLYGPPGPGKEMRMELWDNPVGTDGFEFIEYTAPDISGLNGLFEQMGFRAVGRHRSKDVTLHRQGQVNFIVNAEPDSHGARFARAHGPSVCAMAFRVRDAGAAYETLLARGAVPFANTVGPMELNIPAIQGIGGSVIYLVDRYGERSIYDVDFAPTDTSKGFDHEGAG